MKKNIGKKLKSLRLEKKMSKTDLYKAIGIKYETLKKYEDGSILIPLDKLEKITKFFNIPLSLFFLDLDIENRSTKNEELISLKNALLKELDKI